MPPKLPHTPKSRIRSALRQLFLRSRERAAVLKEAGYCCSECGVKQSTAKGKEVKVEVHHKSGIDNWAEIDEYIRKALLNKDDMTVLCKGCHTNEHKED
jgi:predicted HNH restriction endonuclease